MTLGLVPPGLGVRGGWHRASFVSRMWRCVINVPPVWVARDWRLGYSGDRTDPMESGVNGRITDSGATCTKDEDSV